MRFISKRVIFYKYAENLAQTYFCLLFCKCFVCFSINFKRILVRKSSVRLNLYQAVCITFSNCNCFCTHQFEHPISFKLFLAVYSFKAILRYVYNILMYMYIYILVFRVNRTNNKYNKATYFTSLRPVTVPCSNSM